MKRYSNVRIRCFIFLLSAPLGVGPSRSSLAQRPTADKPAPQIARGIDLVVLVNGKKPSQGSGIIVGASRTSIYILTALHVVGPGSPDTVHVEFHFDQPKLVAATVMKKLPPSSDTSLSDVALLSVLRDSVPAFDKVRLEFDRLGDPDRMRVGDRVLSIGCPSGNCWEAHPDERVFGVGKQVVIYSQFVREGKSGGAFLNEWGEVVGMIELEEGELPLGRAVNIENLMNQVRLWLNPAPPEILHRSTFPRRGYALEFGASLFGSKNRSRGHPPSGRVDLAGHLASHLDWRLGVVRLAPENLALTAATVGLAIPLGSSRFSISAFLDGGMGRTEARHDLGGYSTTANGVTTYHPNWAITEGAGFGGGVGLSIKMLVLPRTFLELVATRWGFQTPADSPPIPDLFFGGGLRWAIR